MAMLEISMSMHIDTENRKKSLNMSYETVIERKKLRCVLSNLYSTEMLELYKDIVLY